jgi:hypothetical protein
MVLSSITTYHRVTIRSFPQSRFITRLQYGPFPNHDLSPGYNMVLSSITTYHRGTIRSFPQSRLITGLQYGPFLNHDLSPGYNTVLSSITTYHWVCNKSNTTGVTNVTKCPPFRGTWVHPRFLVGFVLFDL